MPVKCGRGGYHETAKDVFRCYNGERVPQVEVDSPALSDDEPRATDRQVDYAIALLNQHGLRTATPINAYGRRLISEVINAARGDRIPLRLKTRLGLVGGYTCESPKCADAAVFRLSLGLAAKHTSFHCHYHTELLRSPENTVSPIACDGASLEPNAPADHGVRPFDQEMGNLPQKPESFDPETLADGFYLFRGEVYKVVVAVHGSGRKYAKRLDDSGVWMMAHGRIRDLRPNLRMTLQQALSTAKRHGLNPQSELYGRCFVCGRTLTDDESIINGIGPVCAAKYA